MRVRPFVPALVATALSLAPSALSLAPLGRVYAQDVDLGKICNQLRDPTFFPIDASGKYALPKGLEEQQRDQVFTVLRLRVHAYYMLRRAELNREAEAQLNIMEEIGLTEEPSPEAKAALDRIRKGLQADTQLDQKQAEAFGKQAADAFKTLCANIQPSSITLQPLPGLLPLSAS